MSLTKLVLTSARDLIRTKGKWFGGDNPSGPNPRRLCVGLAIVEAAGGRSSEIENAALVAFLQSATGSSSSKAFCFLETAQYNNSHTYAEVMTALDNAITAEA